MDTPRLPDYSTYEQKYKCAILHPRILPPTYFSNFFVWTCIPTPQPCNSSENDLSYWPCLLALYNRGQLFWVTHQYKLPRHEQWTEAGRLEHLRSLVYDTHIKLPVGEQCVVHAQTTGSHNSLCNENVKLDYSLTKTCHYEENPQTPDFLVAQVTNIKVTSISGVR